MLAFIIKVDITSEEMLEKIEDIKKEIQTGKSDRKPLFIIGKKIIRKSFSFPHYK